MGEHEAPKGELNKSQTSKAVPDAFVRGGTPTMKSEALYERRFQEAEKRRDEQAAEEGKAERVKGYSDRKKADVEMASALNKATTKGNGTLFQNQFTRHPEIPKAYVLLEYCHKNGDQVRFEGEPVYGQADLIVGLDPLFPEELSLILVCPRCVQQGQKHLQDCQMTIRQRNRNFEFRSGLGPPTFVFQGQTYRSAGMIVESEAFHCPDCNWRARISKNRVVPD